MDKEDKGVGFVEDAAAAPDGVRKGRPCSKP